MVKNIVSKTEVAARTADEIPLHTAEVLPVNACMWAIVRFQSMLIHVVSFILHQLVQGQLFVAI